MACKPECLDVLLAELFNNRSDDVLEILIVRRRPCAPRREWSCDHQPVFINVVQEREVVALPSPIGPTAVQTEDKRDFLALLQIARVVNEVGASRFLLHHRPAAYHRLVRAVLVGTVLHWRLRACRAREPDWLLSACITGGR